MTEFHIKVNRSIQRISLKQSNILKTDHHVFILNDDGLDEIIQSSSLKMSDFAICVTGIYTGNNKSFIYVKNSEVKGSKGYSVVEDESIDFKCISLTGVKSPFKYVPLVKGNSIDTYIREEIVWFLDWTSEAIKHYNTDKKARFQNSMYYFKKGIALPMVKSSKISATIMENMVFDQSIVGIFPKNEKYLYYLLAILNSRIFNKLLHLINPTANNSANYVKKVPIPLPGETELEKINKYIIEIINKHSNKREIEDLLNAYIEELYMSIDCTFTQQMELEYN